MPQTYDCPVNVMTIWQCCCMNSLPHRFLNALCDNWRVHPDLLEPPSTMGYSHLASSLHCQSTPQHYSTQTKENGCERDGDMWKERKCCSDWWLHQHQTNWNSEKRQRQLINDAILQKLVRNPRLITQRTALFHHPLMPLQPKCFNIIWHFWVLGTALDLQKPIPDIHTGKRRQKVDAVFGACLSRLSVLICKVF